VIFGLILRPVLLALSPENFPPLEATGSVVTDTIRGWLAIPAEATSVGNFAFAVLIALVLVISRMKQKTARFIVLVPTLYLLMFVWETRLSQEPSITRLLFVGVLLIVLMIYRPNGLLGERRVEVA
jgi:ABC-type branched-subunit amino acid transport system permease subunit